MNQAFQDAAQAVTRYLRSPLEQPPARPAPFRLMDLPRELRDMIYKEVAKNTHVNSPDQRLDYEYLRVHIPILQTSKLLEEECTPILLRHATIELHVRPKFTGFWISFLMCAYSSTLPPSMLPPLRKWHGRSKAMKRLAWYEALTKNENLSFVFESRCAPGNLDGWVRCFAAASHPKPLFAYTVRIRKGERMFPVHKQEVDNTTANMFGAMIARRSRKGGSLDEVRKIREAYHQAGCNVGY